MEVNGHDNQDNVVVANSHMNLNTVDYPIANESRHQSV